MNPRFWIAMALVPSLLVAIGCGGKPAGYSSAYGKLSYKGEPAAGAILFFHPEGRTGDSKDVVVPSATVEADGSFSLSSPTGVGAPPGKYAVLVSWPVADPALEAPDTTKKKGAKTSIERRKNKLDPQASDRLKGRYFDAKKPLLTAEIKPEATDLGTLEIKD